MNVSHSLICEADIIQQHDPLLQISACLLPFKELNTADGQERESLLPGHSVGSFL
jgi:hypothetical protein